MTEGNRQRINGKGRVLKERADQRQYQESLGDPQSSDVENHDDNKNQWTEYETSCEVVRNHFNSRTRRWVFGVTTHTQGFDTGDPDIRGTRPYSGVSEQTTSSLTFRRTPQVSLVVLVVLTRSSRSKGEDDGVRSYLEGTVYPNPPRPTE